MASKKEKLRIRMNAEEIKLHLVDLIAGNRYIQNQGKTPIGLNIEGEAGLGKTSVVMQFAEEHGLQMVKRNQAEIEELGDLVGFPVRQFQLCKAPKEMVEARDAFYRKQSQSQMDTVDSNYMRENDPRMPVFNDRKSKVTFGGGT